MRVATELIRAWTEALVPICNNSKSHASQEVKWLLHHAKQQSCLPAKSTSSNNDRTGTRGLSKEEVDLMQDYIKQRVEDRKPLQYILGIWETEEWTMRLVTVLMSEPRLFQRASPTSTPLSNPSLFNILELCAGSGCISLGLASSLPAKSCSIFGVDIHSAAVQLARDNKVRNQALLNKNRVQFQQADLFATNAVDTFLRYLEDQELTGINGSNNEKGEEDKSEMEIKKQQQAQRAARNVGGARGVTGYNLVVANPPYIAHSEYDTLEAEVAKWEDPKALLAEEDGLEFYPRIANMAMELLHRRSSWSSPISKNDSSSTIETESASVPRAYGDTKLDPRTLERIYYDDDTIEDEDNSNNDKDSNDEANSDDLSVEEREWRNGPDLDKVKIPELVLEIGGDHQVDSVTAAVRNAGFRRVEVWKDLADRARCIVGAR
ncbi:hypothetical protein BG011_009454 [Mortierella polycephala]|uniref:Type II methyltransferase M.TaqI-like domain-containing protein n=1 Tax=Mortierella polycephala TaxID=41804 RepID=A0A9P6PMW9_9FUNG|nr:hypothetical protein BG011_009454 [Mortierella polycephala]